MLQHMGICVAIICAGVSCSRANLDKSPLLSNQVLDRATETTVLTPEPRPAPTAEEATAPVPMSKEDDAEEEKVIPPGNISGSYLICMEMKSPTTAAPESTVNCALRDQKTNNKIALKTQYSSVQWSYEYSGSGSLNILLSELLTSPEWHVTIALKAASLEEVQAQRNAVKFLLTVQDSAGVQHQEASPVSMGALRWLALDGGRIPANAAVGGTEHDGADSLFLCRLYNNGDIIPGKMIVHYNDSSKSICYATTNNGALTSHSDDARTLIYRSDVLVITQGSFDEYFEWLPASNGLKPAQAIISGVDPLGNPLYACRGLQADDAVDEQTPGVLRPGAAGCSHEYYGVNITANYQVLAWKEAATKKIMDGRVIPPP
ncbi:DM9 repeat-containing protein [Oligoflexus tunisiensis]|uniref:DM9 repeat-containing protein n=1 Tax=Oligoflexus tunisiensis TaxID=708132 RepID=UPI00114D1BF2|nr:DM9 repeat-containing protein [Oligoflexus tunisiensis]